MAQQQLALDIVKKFFELVYPYSRTRDPFIVSHGTRGGVSAVLEPQELHPGDVIHVKARSRFAAAESDEVSAMQTVSLQLLSYLETQGILPDDWWRWPADWQAAREPGVVRFYLVCTLLSIKEGFYTPRRNITSYHIGSSYQSLADDILDDMIHEGSVTQNSMQQVRLASVDDYNRRQQQTQPQAYAATYAAPQQQQPSYDRHPTSIQQPTSSQQQPTATYSWQQQQTSYSYLDSYLDRSQTDLQQQYPSAVGVSDTRPAWEEARQAAATAPPATVKPAVSPTRASTGYAAAAYGSYSGANNRAAVPTTGRSYRSPSPPRRRATAAASYQQPEPPTHPSHQQQRRPSKHSPQRTAAGRHLDNLSPYDGAQQPLQQRKARPSYRSESPPASDRHYEQQQLALSLQQAREQQYGQPAARHGSQQQQQQLPSSRWTQDRAAAAAAAVAAGRPSTSAAGQRAVAKQDRDPRPPPVLVKRSAANPSRRSPSSPAAQHTGSRYPAHGSSAGRDQSRDPVPSPRLHGELAVSPRSHRAGAAREALPRTRDRSASRRDPSPHKRPRHHESPAGREKPAADRDRRSAADRDRERDRDRDRSRDRSGAGGTAISRRPQEPARARDKGPLHSSSSPARGRHQDRDRTSGGRELEVNRDRARDRSAARSNRGNQAGQASNAEDGRRDRSPRREGGDHRAAGSDPERQRHSRTADRSREGAHSSRDRETDRERDWDRDRRRDRDSSSQGSRRDKEEGGSERDRAVKAAALEDRIRQVFAASRVDVRVDPSAKTSRIEKPQQQQQQQQEQREEPRRGNERQEPSRRHTEQQQQQQQQQQQRGGVKQQGSPAPGPATAALGSGSGAATAGASCKPPDVTQVKTIQQYASAAVQLVLAAAPFAVDLGPLKFQLAAAGDRLGVSDSSIDALVQLLVQEGLFEVIVGEDKYNKGLQYVRAVKSHWSPAAAQQLGTVSAGNVVTGTEGPAGDAQMRTAAAAAGGAAALAGDGRIVGSIKSEPDLIKVEPVSTDRAVSAAADAIAAAAAGVVEAAAPAAAGRPAVGVRLKATAVVTAEHKPHIKEEVMDRAAAPQVAVQGADTAAEATGADTAAAAGGEGAGYAAGVDEGNQLGTAESAVTDDEEIPETVPASPLVESAVDAADEAAAATATLVAAAADLASQAAGGMEEAAHAGAMSVVLQPAAAWPPVPAAVLGTNAPAAIVSPAGNCVSVDGHPAAPDAGLHLTVPTLDLRPAAAATASACCTELLSTPQQAATAEAETGVAGGPDHHGGN